MLADLTAPALSEVLHRLEDAGIAALAACCKGLAQHVRCAEHVWRLRCHRLHVTDLGRWRDAHAAASWRELYQLLRQRRGLPGMYTTNRPPWGRLVWVALEPPVWRAYAVLVVAMNGAPRLRPLWELHADGRVLCLAGQHRAAVHDLFPQELLADEVDLQPPAAEPLPPHPTSGSYVAAHSPALVVAACDQCATALHDDDRQLVVFGHADEQLPRLVLPEGWEVPAVPEVHPSFSTRAAFHLWHTSAAMVMQDVEPASFPRLWDTAGRGDGYVKLDWAPCAAGNGGARLQVEPAREAASAGVEAPQQGQRRRQQQPQGEHSGSPAAASPSAGTRSPGAAPADQAAGPSGRGGAEGVGAPGGPRWRSDLGLPLRIAPRAQPPGRHMLEGFWRATYGPHGIEVLALRLHGAEGEPGSVQGTKVTGDPNVCAGAVSLLVMLDQPLAVQAGQEFQLPAGYSCVTDLAAARQRAGAPLRVVARYAAKGRIAGLGYEDASFSAAEVQVLGPHAFYMLWHDLASCSLFARLPV